MHKFSITILVSILLFSTIYFGAVEASTQVSGIISINTTWIVENSPYVVTSPLLVDNGVTLTIEPGVVVYLNDTYMKVNGTLSARGNTTHPILLISNGTSGLLYPQDNAAIQFTEYSTDWNEETGLGSIIENAVVNTTRPVFTIYTDRVSPKINNCTVVNTGGQRSIFVDGGAPVISNCTITSNFAGITCSEGFGENTNLAQILDNTITDCEVGISISEGSPLIQGNLIANNTGNKNNGNGGIRIDYVHATPIIQNNTIIGNTVGFNMLNSPSPTIVYNNIVGNIEYNVYQYAFSGADINATNNWWGTTNVDIINQTIRDFKNDFNLGVINFVPFLAEANLQAPEIPSWVPEPELDPDPEPNPDVTYVSGIIAQNTTWTQENSPYFATTPLLVDNGVTLTIEPGVVVYLNDTYMKVNGTLNARGAIENPISVICNGTGLGIIGITRVSAIQFTEHSTSWGEGTGSIIENAFLSSTQASPTVYIDHISPKINNCTVVNTGNQRSILVDGGAPVISNCTITSNNEGITCGAGSGDDSNLAQ
ncbi:MAG: hypothetical protein CW716_05705, partial [Candidatus Bathyarchaeum sp.]